MITAEAYRFCREVAKREAKNFYWAFRVLPKHKSDAMCAVYAFMRRADDISDDESKTLDARRVEMTAWMEDWRESRITDLVGNWEYGSAYCQYIVSHSRVIS